jgi:hypothetical protein
MNKIKHAGLAFDIHGHLGKKYKCSNTTAKSNVVVDPSKTPVSPNEKDQQAVPNAQKEERKAEISKFLVSFENTHLYLPTHFWFLKSNTPHSKGFQLSSQQRADSTVRSTSCL